MSASNGLTAFIPGSPEVVDHVGAAERENAVTQASDISLGKRHLGTVVSVLGTLAFLYLLYAVERVVSTGVG